MFFSFVFRQLQNQNSEWGIRDITDLSGTHHSFKFQINASI